jgi:ketosteroid isomerase-like protein
MGALGIVAEGKEAIRETWAGMAAMGQPIDFRITSRPVQVDGDLAYAHLTGTALIKSSETGEEDTMEIRATEVMHRGVDGQWRYTIDHA